MKEPDRKGRLELKAAHTRKRDVALGAASLTLHIIVFLLLPSLAPSAKLPFDLLVEIVKQHEVQPEPEPVVEISEATDVPDWAVETVQTSPLSPEASHQQPGGAPAESPPASQEQAEAQPAPPMEQAPTAANVATDVVIPDPIAVPVEVEPEVADKPAEEAPAKPQPTPEVKVEQPKPPVVTPAEKAETKPVLPGVDVPDPGSAPKPDPVEPVETGNDEPTKEPKEDPVQGDPGPAAGPEVPPADPGPPAPPPGPSQHELDILKGYGDKARRKIMMLVRMPELAREQGLKGTVKFEFEVASDGKLIGMKVLDSSGHPVLDEEALEACRVAGFFGRFPKDVKVKKWKFKMTLSFPLY